MTVCERLIVVTGSAAAGREVAPTGKFPGAPGTIGVEVMTGIGVAGAGEAGGVGTKMTVLGTLVMIPGFFVM